VLHSDAANRARERRSDAAGEFVVKGNLQEAIDGNEFFSVGSGTEFNFALFDLNTNTLLSELSGNLQSPLFSDPSGDAFQTMDLLFNFELGESLAITLTTTGIEPGSGFGFIPIPEPGPYRYWSSAG